ncbi:GRIK4 [Branchiostoma lanceolatum]|uniref:GRIK4 protein n=1 Tax=Branchiostoma lanceolatum TaxID=7740 RepID=A0A8J9VYC7_BRALA|nr:GRIK4 [Branchiostoma lanceolatum]
MAGLRTVFLLAILSGTTALVKSESVRIGVLLAPGGSCQSTSRTSKCAQNLLAAKTAVEAANDANRDVGVALQMVTSQIVGGETRAQMAEKAKSLSQGVCALFLVGDDEHDKRLDDVFAYVTNDPIPRFYIHRRVSRSEYNYYMLPGNERTHVMVSTITRAYKWQAVAVIHDGIYDMEGVEHVLAQNTDDRVPMGVYILPSRNGDVINTLLQVRASGIRKIILHSELDLVKTVISKAAELDMVNQYYHWMVSHPQTLDKWNEILPRDMLGSPEARITAFQYDLPTQLSNMSPYQLLVDDAITAFARGVRALKGGEGNAENCRQNILSYIPQGVPFEGKTGLISFDSDGARSNITVDVLEFQSDGFKSAGSQSLGGSAILPRSQYLRPSEVWNLYGRKTFNIVAFQDSLFFKDKDNGYLVDLLKEMAKKNRGNFDYNLTILKDIGLSGVIGRHLATNATHGQQDFALTLAPLRKKFLAQVDITRPIATLGYTVTMRRQDPPAITLLSPLRNYTWAYILVVYACVCLLSHFIDKLDPYEWGMRSKDEVDQKDDSFSLIGSFWQGLTSFCRQGVEKSPRSIGGRIITGSWWFFALVIFAYYVSTFSAILSKDDTIKVNSVSDLAYQNKIAYGLNKKITPLINFFKNTETEPYATMWRYMKKNRRNLVDSNEAGMRKVMGDHQCGDGGKFAGTNESYAFITTSRVEFDYRDKYNCTLRTVGNYFLPYELGLPFPKGSVFKDIFDKIIIDMQNDGTLQKLQMKWLMSPTRQCPREDTTSMKVLAPDGLAPMFGVVGGAIVLGVLVALVELIVYKTQTKRERREKDGGGSAAEKRGCCGRLLSSCCRGKGDEKSASSKGDDSDDLAKMPAPLPPLVMPFPTSSKEEEEETSRADELLARLAAMSNAAAALGPMGDYHSAQNGFPKPPANPALNQGVKRDVTGVSKQGTFQVSSPDKETAPAPPSDFRA